MERVLSQFRAGTDNAETQTNKVTQGTWTESDLRGSNTQNNTASHVNDRLNQNANDNGNGAPGAQTSSSNNLSTSTNALRTQNVSSGTTPDTSASQNAVNKANPTGKTGANTSVAPGGTQNQSVQVAAAVALNITNHKAVNTVNGSIKAGDTVTVVVRDGKVDIERSTK